MNKRWLIVAVVASYLIMLFGGALLKPGYSHLGQYISELNAAGTPYASLIGWFGFVPFAVLSAALLVAAAPVVPVRGVSRLGYWLLLSEPIAYLGSALAPCDIGCPAEGSVSQMIHNALAIVTYLTTSVALVLLAFTPRISKFMRVVWVAAAMVWLTLFGMMADPGLSEWRGLLQRLAEWTVFGLLLASAWWCITRQQDSGRSGEAMNLR
ncbi:MAG: hypothetical protein CMK70_03585 [Pseudohongiella sp.]|nr:hypothetical protein [Pseudohongiella sp.]|tara:strand:- start:3211 stop:3840 length:630 start_codon:yes stop_codon:yes gene_type:complete